jgi:hypothetical protein
MKDNSWYVLLATACDRPDDDAQVRMKERDWVGIAQASNVPPGLAAMPLDVRKGSALPEPAPRQLFSGGYAAWVFGGSVLFLNYARPHTVGVRLPDPATNTGPQKSS